MVLKNFVFGMPKISDFLARRMCAKYGLDTVLVERKEELSMILQNGIFVKPIITRL
jgi:hypothetical protein